VYNTTFRCHPGGHGVVDLRRAIASRATSTSTRSGSGSEIARLAKWAKLMGLGAPTGVDLPAEASGLMPSAEWKLRVLKAPWYAGETGLGRDRAGPGERDADPDGARRRRSSRTAAGWYGRTSRVRRALRSCRLSSSRRRSPR
jgi:hypothetical protein